MPIEETYSISGVTVMAAIIIWIIILGKGYPMNIFAWRKEYRRRQDWKRGAE